MSEPLQILSNLCINVLISCGQRFPLFSKYKFSTKRIKYDSPGTILEIGFTDLQICLCQMFQCSQLATGSWNFFSTTFS